MKTSRIPYDLTVEVRREHRSRLLAREISWLCVVAAVGVLAVGMGCLAATANSPLLTVLAGAVVVAGVKGGHYLVTRH